MYLVQYKIAGYNFFCDALNPVPHDAVFTSSNHSVDRNYDMKQT